MGFSSFSPNTSLYIASSGILERETDSNKVSGAGSGLRRLLIAETESVPIKRNNILETNLVLVKPFISSIKILNAKAPKTPVCLI